MFLRRRRSSHPRPSSSEGHRGGTFGLTEGDPEKGPSMESQIDPEEYYREKKAPSDELDPYAGTVWVRVYGFSPAEAATAMQEINVCGTVLHRVPDLTDLSSVYMLFKDTCGAYNALSMDGVLINDNLIIGVEHVDREFGYMLYDIIRDVKCSPFTIHGSVPDHDEKGKRCHGIPIDLPAYGEWVCVYRFSAADTDLVFREFETCGEILSHMYYPTDSRSMYIQYKLGEDAKKALDKDGMQIGDNRSIGVKPLDPEHRWFLNFLVYIIFIRPIRYMSCSRTTTSTKSTGVDVDGFLKAGWYTTTSTKSTGVDVDGSLKAGWYKLKDLFRSVT